MDLGIQRGLSYGGIGTRHHSKERHIHLTFKVNVLRLNARRRRPEQSVPELRLLPVVAALPPPLAMMQVMIFNDEFTAHKLQHERREARRDGIHAQPRVTHDLCEQNIRLANPPIAEVHRQAEPEPHGKKREQRDDDRFNDFLLGIGEAGENWYGVLGEMVCSVVFPEKVNFVTCAVVGVEPEVEDYGV